MQQPIIQYNIMYVYIHIYIYILYKYAEAEKDETSLDAAFHSGEMGMPPST